MSQQPYNAPVGLSYSHISNAGTNVVKTAPGMLQAININQGASAAAATVYDNIAGSGSVVAVITLGAAVTTPQPIPYGVNLTKGLAIVTTGSIDLTVVYR